MNKAKGGLTKKEILAGATGAVLPVALYGSYKVAKNLYDKWNNTRMLENGTNFQPELNPPPTTIQPEITPTTIYNVVQRENAMNNIFGKRPLEPATADTNIGLTNTGEDAPIISQPRTDINPESDLDIMDYIFGFGAKKSIKNPYWSGYWNDIKNKVGGFGEFTISTNPKSQITSLNTTPGSFQTYLKNLKSSENIPALDGMSPEQLQQYGKLFGLSDPDQIIDRLTFDQYLSNPSESEQQYEQTASLAKQQYQQRNSALSNMAAQGKPKQKPRKSLKTKKKGKKPKKQNKRK